MATPYEITKSGVINASQDVFICLKFFRKTTPRRYTCLKV
jgi:hypothetical protein